MIYVSVSIYFSPPKSYTLRQQRTKKRYLDYFYDENSGDVDEDGEEEDDGVKSGDDNDHDGVDGKNALVTPSDTDPTTTTATATTITTMTTNTYTSALVTTTNSSSTAATITPTTTTISNNKTTNVGNGVTNKEVSGKKRGRPRKVTSINGSSLKGVHGVSINSTPAYVVPSTDAATTTATNDKNTANNDNTLTTAHTTFDDNTSASHNVTSVKRKRGRPGRISLENEKNISHAKKYLTLTVINHKINTPHSNSKNHATNSSTVFNPTNIFTFKNKSNITTTTTTTNLLATTNPSATTLTTTTSNNHESILHDHGGYTLSSAFSPLLHANVDMLRKKAFERESGEGNGEVAKEEEEDEKDEEEGEEEGEEDDKEEGENDKEVKEDGRRQGRGMGVSGERSDNSGSPEGRLDAALRDLINESSSLSFSSQPS